MELKSTKASAIERWGPRCHLTLMIGVGLTTAYLGVHGAHAGGGGWFAKLTAGTIFFILGFLGTHLGLDLLFRLVSPTRYLWTYGFSGEGLASESRSDEMDSSKE